MSFSGDVIPDGVAYKQCLISRGSSRTVAYLPVRYAKVGKLLRIKQEDGSWLAGFKVDEVWGGPVADPPDYHKFHPGKRK